MFLVIKNCSILSTFLLKKIYGLLKFEINDEAIGSQIRVDPSDTFRKIQVEHTISCSSTNGEATLSFINESPSGFRSILIDNIEAQMKHGRLLSFDVGMDESYGNFRAKISVDGHFNLPGLRRA